jgi:hypothetical protein
MNSNSRALKRKIATFEKIFSISYHTHNQIKVVLANVG